jgi:hypothetical protein
VASKRTVVLAKLKAGKALAVESGLDLTTLLIKLIQPFGQTDDVWAWANGQGERFGQEAGSDNRSFLTSIAAMLVAGLLQAVSRLAPFAAEQDRSLLAIQLATNAKQRMLEKKVAHPDQNNTPGERASVEAHTGSWNGTGSITDTGHQTFVRKAKRAKSVCLRAASSSR